MAREWAEIIGDHARRHQDSSLSDSVVVNGRSLLAIYDQEHVEVEVDPASGLSVEDIVPMVSVLAADLDDDPRHGWTVFAGGVAYIVNSSRLRDGTHWDLLLEVVE